jgi:hypothetical protein
VIVGAITAAVAVVAGAPWSVAALGAEDAAAVAFVIWSGPRSPARTHRRQRGPLARISSAP